MLRLIRVARAIAFDDELTALATEKGVLKGSLIQAVIASSSKEGKMLLASAATPLHQVSSPAPTAVKARR